MLSLGVTSFPGESRGQDVANSARTKSAIDALIVDAEKMAISGAYAEAEAKFHAALKLAKDLGGSELGEARALAGLAFASAKEGKYAEAEWFALRELRIRESKLDVASDELTASLQQLATIYYYQSKWDRVESVARRAIQARDKAEGKKKFNNALYDLLIGSLLMQEKCSDAATIAEIAKRRLDEAIGNDRPDSIRHLGRLAEIYARTGQSDLEEAALLECLRVAERNWGSGNSLLPKPLNRCVAFYINHGRFDDAEAFISRSLQIARATHGELSVPTAVNLGCMGVVRTKQKRFTEAGDFYEKSLRLFQRIPSPADPTSALEFKNAHMRLKNEYGKMLRLAGRGLEAAELLDDD